MNGSDFFIDMVSVGFMYIAAFICGLAGKTKTPAGQAESKVWHGNQQRFKKQCRLAPLSN
ncbi:hypothetical protein ACQCPQ_05475 [Priestia megaterium]|uniref:hypothetical protein n=1 Tax=Priestia megaterium TaxID=1404 RepID=UPI003D09417F